jgi:hypothetical protein
LSNVEDDDASVEVEDDLMTFDKSKDNTDNDDSQEDQPSSNNENVMRANRDKSSTPVGDRDQEADDEAEEEPDNGVGFQSHIFLRRFLISV